MMKPNNTYDNENFDHTPGATGDRPGHLPPHGFDGPKPWGARGGRPPFGRPMTPGGRGGWGRGPGMGFPFNGPMGGPFGGPQRSPRGAIRVGLIALLAEEPRNGYGLMQAFQAKTDGRMQPKSGTVYPALNQLVNDALVSVDEEGVYTLTDSGVRTAEEQAPAAKALFEQIQAGDEPALFDSFRKLMSALHQVAISGDQTQQAAVAQKLDELRRDIYRTLSE